MQQNSDLIDLLRALNAEGVNYLIIGGYAFAWHGRVCATKDVGIFVGTSAENARNVRRALVVFGAPLDDLSEIDLTVPQTFFLMGRAPNQIDIITTIDGVTFDDAWKRRVEGTYGDIPVWYISRDDLIANKRAAGRPQDLADVDYLTREAESP